MRVFTFGSGVVVVGQGTFDGQPCLSIDDIAAGEIGTIVPEGTEVSQDAVLLVFPDRQVISRLIKDLQELADDTGESK